MDREQKIADLERLVQGGAPATRALWLAYLARLRDGVSTAVTLRRPAQDAQADPVQPVQPTPPAPSAQPQPTLAQSASPSRSARLRELLDPGQDVQLGGAPESPDLPALPDPSSDVAAPPPAAFPSVPTQPVAAPLADASVSPSSDPVAVASAVTPDEPVTATPPADAESPVPPGNAKNQKNDLGDLGDPFAELAQMLGGGNRG